jgi:hypothetical protein
VKILVGWTIFSDLTNGYGDSEDIL